MAKQPKNVQPAWRTKFRNVTFAIVGRLTQLGKSEAIDRIKIYGGTLADKVSEATDYLVVGETRGAGPSQAEQCAAKFNANKGAAIRVIKESDFLEMLMPTGDEALAMLTSAGGVEAWQKIRWWHGSFAVDLRNANLRGASLSGANLRQVNLDAADLTGADLSKSYLPTLRDAKLNGANLRECCPEGVVNSQLKSVDMTGATFYHRGLYQQADFSGAILKDASTIAAKFVDSSFKNADLTGAKLRTADLSKCDFTEAKLVDGMFAHSAFSNSVWKDFI